MDETDVVVVGAGPVGLLLAAEIALGGGRVTVVEQLAEPSTTIKAGSINLASAELLGRRGLADGLREISERTMARVGGTGPAVGRSGRAGHFAGLWLRADLVDDDDPALAGHLEALGTSFVPQQDIEALLGRHAVDLGVEVRRGVAVTGVDSGDDGVTVHTARGTVRAGWVVGCDGGRSQVRRAAGFDFPGSDPEITGRQALVELADDTGLRRGWNWSTDGVYCYGPLPGRVLTVEFDGPPADRDAPVGVREIQDSLRRTSGVDVTVTRLLGQATRWTDNARQVTDYRRGRVLLAGDAAHVHSPFSGQGLNLGLADAMNLGWKLAAVVAGRAPAELLDTYSEERHPPGAWVLDWTRAQVALMRPDAKVGPLRDAVADLLGTRTGATLTTAKISGLLHRTPRHGDHPLDGRSVPDVELGGGRMLREAFGSGSFVLLDPSGLGGVLDPWPGRVEIVRADRPTALFVRPDGIVAWAADGPDAAGLSDAARRWLGPPAA